MDVGEFLGILLVPLGVLIGIMAVLINTKSLKRRFTKKQQHLFEISFSLISLVTILNGAIVCFYFCCISYTSPLDYEILFGIGVILLLLMADVIRYRKKFGKRR